MDSRADGVELGHIAGPRWSVKARIEVTSMSSRLSARSLGFSGLDITLVGFGAWAYLDTIAAAIARAGAGAGPLRPAPVHHVAAS